MSFEACSEQTAELIDKEISDIAEEQYQRAIACSKATKINSPNSQKFYSKMKSLFKDNLNNFW